MEKEKDKFNREMCPVCGKPLSLSVVSNSGDAVISVFCRRCKSVSEIRLPRK